VIRSLLTGWRHKLFEKKPPSRAGRLLAGAALLLGGALAVLGGLWWYGHQEKLAAEQALRLGEGEEAWRHIHNCLAVWPWSHREAAHLLAARIARLGNRFDEAEQELNECKRLRGDTSEAIQLEWLLLRAQNGELDRLWSGLWAYVEQERPEAPLVLETLTLVTLREARIQRAAACLERWQQLEPDNPRIRELRGALYLTVQEYPQAEQELRQVVAAAPERRQARLLLAEALLRQQNTPEALPQLELLHQRFPDWLEVYVPLAQCYELLGRTEEARQLLQAVVLQKPQHSQATFLLGKLELQTGHLTEAEKWLRRAIDLDRGNLMAWFNLHLCLRQQPGREKEAEAILQEHNRLQKDIDRLNQLLREEVDRRPDDPAVALEVAQLSLRTGNEPFALRWLLIALDRDPRNPAVHRALADYYERHQQPDLAAQHRRLAQ
jgi:predicted Zn-dependent protease